MAIKKFINTAKSEMVEKEDILKSGDWMLKWDPDAVGDQTGFALFTPKEFDPERGDGAPLGGLILAAVYFILEHGDPSFARELIDKANELSKEVGETKPRPAPSGRTLN